MSVMFQRVTEAVTLRRHAARGSTPGTACIAIWHGAVALRHRVIALWHGAHCSSARDALLFGTGRIALWQRAVALRQRAIALLAPGDCSDAWRACVVVSPAPTAAPTAGAGRSIECSGGWRASLQGQHRHAPGRTSARARADQDEKALEQTTARLAYVCTHGRGRPVDVGPHATPHDNACSAPIAGGDQNGAAE